MNAVDAKTPRSSSTALIRLTVLLIAVWSLLGGLALTLYQGEGGGALAAGIGDEAGQRLAGAQMIVLAPLYLLIAWKANHFGGLLWVPFAAQAATALAIAYSILAGDTDTLDGAPFLAISGGLALLLAFLWITEQRESARLQYEDSRSLDDGVYEDGQPSS